MSPASEAMANGVGHGMMWLLSIHIAGGSIALIAGFVAIFAIKGMRLHRRTGMIFVYAMLVMATAGATLAALRDQPLNIIGGCIAIYFVASGVLTLRERDGGFQWIDAATMAVGLTVAGFCTRFAMEMWHDPGKTVGPGVIMLGVFAGLALLGAFGDLRLILERQIRGRRRITRHVWRMCFALFVASGSFFLGQAKVIPKPVRIFPLLAVPAFLPLVLMFYWLARLALTRKRNQLPFHTADDRQLQLGTGSHEFVVRETAT